MAFKVHMTNEDYEKWKVQSFLEHELQDVRELNEKEENPMLVHVIEYLEKRLNGTIQ